MMTKLLLCPIAAVLFSLPLAAQVEQVKEMAKDAHPSFDVATIRPSNSENHNQGFHTSGARLFYENQTMIGLICFAYGVHGKQIVNTPDWFTKDRFDIKGAADVPGQPNARQQAEMLQKLLVARFGLKFHKEQREMGIFLMTALKSAPEKLKVNTSGDSLPDQTGNGGNGTQSWVFTNNTMADFAQFLQYFLDRPVVDKTSLTGHYDFKLQWTPDNAAVTDAAAAPGFYTAVQEQAGLKVEPTHGKVDAMVIDAAAKPAEN